MRTLPALLVVVLLASAALAQGAPRVTTAHARVASDDGRVIFKVKYPQVHGTAVDAAVNGQLRGWYVPERKQLNAQAKGVERGLIYDNDVDGQVTLCTPTLLSAAYYGLGVLTLDGRMNTAHPSKTNRAFTFDLRTGKVIPLSALFKKGSAWKKKLDELLVAHKSPVDPPAQYGYYLTGKKLVLMNLSDIFAVASVEIPIPFTELGDIVDPAGPLASLLAK